MKINLFGLIVDAKIMYILITIIGGYFIYKIVSLIVNGNINKILKKTKTEQRRQKTISVVVNNLLRCAFFLIICFVILGFAGVSAGAIITSIGAVGIVVSLSIQDTLRDVISGILIIIENRYTVGDIVMISSFKGEVTYLGLKTTKLCNETGDIKILSNRNITEITNYSLNNTKMFIDLDLNYDNDEALVENMFNELVSNLSKKIKKIKGDFKYLGVQKIADKITYRIGVEVDVKNQDDVRQAALIEIKKVLDKKGIRR